MPVTAVYSKMCANTMLSMQTKTRGNSKQNEIISIMRECIQNEREGIYYSKKTLFNVIIREGLPWTLILFEFFAI